MKNSRPYFQPEVVDKIVSVFNSELSKENLTVDQAALRKYIAAGKNIYENGILLSVAEGDYVATVQKDEVAYKVNEPSEAQIDEVLDAAKESHEKALAAKKKSLGIPTAGQVSAAIKQTRANRLSHALNMVAYYGTAAKLGVEAQPTEAATELVGATTE